MSWGTVAAALINGRDPLADPDVVRMVVGQTLAGQSGNARVLGVERVANVRIVDAIRENVDELLASMKTAIDAAGRTLADVSLEQFEQLRHDADPWSNVGAGVIIDMADRVTMKDRLARVADEREARSQRPASAFGTVGQKAYGIGVLS